MNELMANLKVRLFGHPGNGSYGPKAACSIATELLSALDLDDCLKILVNRVASYMAVEIVSVMFIDNDKRRLIVKIAKGLNDEIARDEGPQIGEGISGWVGKTGEPLLIKDITKDNRFIARAGGRYYNNSLLSVPLKIRDRVIGVINVNNKVSKDIFRENDLELLKTISGMAVIAVEDIRLEEEARKNKKDSVELVSNVSHEFRTPLATVKEALLLITEGITGQINETQKKYLELSVHNIDRLSRLIDELLESARMRQCASTMRRTLFNVTQAANKTLDSLGILAKGKGIELASAIPDRKIEMWGDPDKLSQIITNLVDNAMKYNKPEGRVEVFLKDDEKAVTIAVSDTGKGIPKDDINRIFDRFYRVDGHDTCGINGTGLGLSIVKDIVTMHRGDIKVESEADKGTKFVITLPKDLRR